MLIISGSVKVKPETRDEHLLKHMAEKYAQAAAT